VSDIGGFDPTFDFSTDAGGGDPDSTSPTLRAYHRLLWSKPLPSGASFDLDDTTLRAYLHHGSERGEFRLTSDAAVPTFIKYPEMTDIIRLVPESEREVFDTTTYQMGGMMLFPGNKIDGKQTINGAKGFHPQIRDRLDVTVECIRQHYLARSSPPTVRLGRRIARRPTKSARETDQPPGRRAGDSLIDRRVARLRAAAEVAQVKADGRRGHA
jgi:hypothetical protein